MNKHAPQEDCRQELARTQARLAEAEARLAQRDLEATELKHRVANNLQLAASFLMLQERKLRPGEARVALAAAGSRIAAVANFHRHLAHNMGRPTLELAAFLQGVAPEIGSSCGLQCHVEAEPVEIPTHAAMNIALVINELAINASKHAYGGGDGSLYVRCRRSPSQDLVITVADDGPGLPGGFDEGSSGLGISIINSITRQLGASLSAETRAEGGARFTLRAPLQSAAPPPPASR